MSEDHLLLSPHTVGGQCIGPCCRFAGIAVFVVQVFFFGWTSAEPLDHRKVKFPGQPLLGDLDDLPTVRRLLPDADAWIDTRGKQVVMDGEVCLREGPLEMFACTRNTKEHESILSINTSAYAVHAALLGLGAESGSPVTYVPQYAPADGSQIDIWVFWRNLQGQRRRAHAQDWVRDARTKESLKHPWVFAGSAFWDDPVNGERHYQAEGGDFICVANFPSAMLDLPIESSQANQSRTFEAFTERIPPVGTKVRIVLKPRLRPDEPVQRTVEDRQ